MLDAVGEVVDAVLGPGPLTIVVPVSNVKEILPYYLITSNIFGRSPRWSISNGLIYTVPSNIFKLKRCWEIDGERKCPGSVRLQRQAHLHSSHILFCDVLIYKYCIKGLKRKLYLEARVVRARVVQHQRLGISLRYRTEFFTPAVINI